MKTALLIGNEPDMDLGYTYVREGEHEAVVVGSLTLGQALHFSEEAVLLALAQGKPVELYTPGLPSAGVSRGLTAALASSYREMKNLGILFISGTRKKWITAQEARRLREAGKRPAPGAVLTPLAREILEGKE